MPYPELAIDCDREHGGCGRPAGLRCKSDQNVEITWFHTPRRSLAGRYGDDDRAALADLGAQLRTAMLAVQRGRESEATVQLIRNDIATVRQSPPVPV
jgi:hypothetical protein